MQIKSILFDFDGTLADTRSTIVRTVQLTLRKLGLPALSEEAIRPMIGLPLRDTFTLAGHIADTALLDRAVEVYRDHFNDMSFNNVSLFPHVISTLHTLQEQGITMAIATSRGRESLLFLLRSLGIADCFSLLSCEGDVPHAKPAPDMALHVLEKIGACASETLMVGDMTYDLDMGRAAGCLTCGVTYGNGTREELTSISPDFLIDDFRALLPILGIKS